MLRLDELAEQSPLTFHVFLELAEALDQSLLELAFADTLADFPLLASRIVRTRFGYRRVAMPITSSDSAIAMADSEQAFVRAPLDVTHDPPVAIALFGQHLIAKVHHSAMDGVGACLWLRQLAGRYAERLTGEPPAAPPPLEPTRSYAQYLTALSWRERLAVVSRAGDTLYTYFLSNGTGTGGPNADYATYMDTPLPARGQVSWQVARIDAETVAGLKAWARSRGATMNDLLFAAFAAAAYQRWPQDLPIIAHIPVNLRSGVPAGAFNRVADVRVVLAPADCREFETAFRATVAVTPAARDRLQAIARIFERYLLSHFPRRVWARLGGAYLDRPRNGIMTFDFSNMGATADLVADFGPARVLGGHIVGPQSAPPGLGCYVTTIRGELALTATYLSPCTKEDSARQLVADIEKSLRELVAPAVRATHPEAPIGGRPCPP